MNLQLEQILTQAIAFLIMLWILKRFAWGPILETMEARKRKIVTEFQAIEEGKQANNDLAAEYKGKLRGLEEEARQRLHDAVENGKKLASEIREEAHREASTILHRAKEEIEREVAKGKVQMKQEIVKLSLAMTEKMLYQELDEDKQKKLISEFIERVEV